MLKKCDDPVGLAYSIIFERADVQLDGVRPEESLVPMAIGLEQAMEMLTARQKSVLMMRFGLGSDSIVYEIGDVARELAISVELARAAQDSGITRLRMNPIRAMIEPYLPVRR